MSTERSGKSNYGYHMGVLRGYKVHVWTADVPVEMSQYSSVPVRK